MSASKKGKPDASTERGIDSDFGGRGRDRLREPSQHPALLEQRRGDGRLEHLALGRRPGRRRR